MKETKGTNLQPDLKGGTTTRRDDDVSRSTVSLSEAAGIKFKTTPAGVGNASGEDGKGPLTP